MMGVRHMSVAVTEVRMDMAMAVRLSIWVVRSMLVAMVLVVGVPMRMRQ